MSIFQNTMLAGSATQFGSYEIEQSIRFNDNDSAYLSRAMGTGGNTNTGTLSLWVKRANLDTTQMLFSQVVSSRNSDIRFHSDNTIQFYLQETAGAGYALAKYSSNLYRDVGAWYHIYATWDTTQSSPEWDLYVNGVQPTWATDTNNGMSQNANIAFFGNSNMDFGRHSTAATYYTDAYLAEINCIEGSVVAISEFAETNADTGQWVPKKYTGSYPGKSFYITGADSADLGADDSGNGNDFTSSGLTAADQVTDSPTNNQATLNPLWAGATLSDGNLVATATGNSYQWALSTFAIDDGGKHVAEFQKSSGTYGYVGIFQVGNHTAKSGNNYMYGIQFSSGEIIKNSAVVASSGTVGVTPANSLMRIEYDSAADTITIFDDGTEIFPASTGVSNTVGFTGHNSLHFGCAPYGSGTKVTATFSPLSGTPTTDFEELTAANLPDPTIADPSAYFQTTLYSGNGSTQEVNQSGNSTFEPGLVWIKTRSNAAHNALFDQVRGVSRQLRTDNTGVEYTAYSDLLTAFDADGFTLGADTIVGNVNVNAYTYVAWQWLADNTSGSSNTDGDVTSTVSVNTTAGFSICKFNPGTGVHTFGHGLGVAPAMVIVKNLQDITNWQVYHQATGAGGKIFLNATNAFTADTNMWDNTAPTSSVVTTGAGLNTAHDHTAYCFAEVENYSKFGSYTGNGSSNGAFIALPFRPALFMLKRYDGTGAWLMFDDKREGYNVDNDNLRANTTDTEQTDDFIDIVSNGVKIRTTNSWLNASGGDYLYMAFASSPFKTATAR